MIFMLAPLGDNASVEIVCVNYLRMSTRIRELSCLSHLKIKIPNSDILRNLVGIYGDKLAHVSAQHTL